MRSQVRNRRVIDKLTKWYRVVRVENKNRMSAGRGIYVSDGAPSVVDLPQQNATGGDATHTMSRRFRH